MEAVCTLLNISVFLPHLLNNSIKGSGNAFSFRLYASLQSSNFLISLNFIILRHSNKGSEGKFLGVFFIALTQNFCIVFIVFSCLLVAELPHIVLAYDM